MDIEECRNLLVNWPKTKRGEETLEKICQAAEMVFCEKGYYRTMISDIARAANIGTGTFYIYFESKLSVYKYLLSQYGHMIRKHISKAIADIPDRRTAERVGLLAWLQFVSEHKSMFNIAWESLFIDKTLFDDYYATFSAAYVTRLDAAKAQGEVKDIDTEVLSFSLMGIANFIGLHWVVFRDEQDLERVVDEVMKLIDGMFTQPKKTC